MEQCPLTPSNPLTTKTHALTFCACVGRVKIVRFKQHFHTYGAEQQATCNPACKRGLEAQHTRRNPSFALHHMMG